jgi:hypothetical protein
MTRTVALTKVADKIESGSSGLALTASEDGLLTDAELAAVNGGGQATGKRQHKPICLQGYYDQ